MTEYAKPDTDPILVTLELIGGSSGPIRGTASWPGAPRPVAFTGILQLVALLERSVEELGIAPREGGPTCSGVESEEGEQTRD